MAVYIKTTDMAFRHAFAELLQTKREESADVDEAVAAIIADVRQNGDAALLRLTETYDRLSLNATDLRFTAREIDEIAAQASPEEKAALEMAAERIAAYHERQIPQDQSWTDEAGAELGWRWTPIESAGLYVPGGLASYPSSVLMNAIPARAAGVERLAITVPTPEGEVNPLVMLAAKIAGVDEIYRIGGAQAVAALAYGTQSVAPVDKITGPGNVYVAAAKRRVFGKVGIDMIAGPSEILLLADKSLPVEWAAMDLLSQAEHDATAQSILITVDDDYAHAVCDKVSELLENLPRREIAEASWRDYGAVLLARDWDEAADLANQLAPEHLEIVTEETDALAGKIRHAGAIFLGGWTPEAIGDYVGGPNHVLPTARSARFSSGLSVLDFMKRTTISRMTPGALAQIGPGAARLAEAESLQAHGMSVALRLQALNTETQ